MSLLVIRVAHRNTSSGAPEDNEREDEMRTTPHHAPCPPRMWLALLAGLSLLAIPRFALAEARDVQSAASEARDVESAATGTKEPDRDPHDHAHGFHDDSVVEGEPKERVYSFGIDELVVTASPLPRKASQLAGAVSTLTGEQLLQKQQPSIGETVRYLPGVSASYFGPGASRPILRGLGGTRVQMLIDQMDVPDASSTSNDHAVTVDTLGVEKIEILRGPATLRFGPNAVGGVVNTIENRVPTKKVDEPLTGSVELRGSSVDGGFGGAAVLSGQAGNVAWRLKGFGFDAGEVSIPGYAESEQLREQEEAEGDDHDGEDHEGEEEEAFGTIPNSQVRYTGFTTGASWIDEKFFVGAAVSNFSTNYGVIFHEADHDHDHGEEGEEGEEPPILIDMNSWSLDLAGGVTDPLEYIHSLEARLRLVDYEHSENEGDFVATMFDKKAYDLRIEAVHERMGIFEGAVGFQSNFSDFKVSGEEAYVPNTYTAMNSLFLIEEADLAPLTLELGARFDYVSVESGGGGAFGPALKRTFPLGSASAGVVYDFLDGQFLSFDASWSMRAPSYAELFARGVHVATGFFEIGDPDLDSENGVGLNLGYTGQFAILDWSVNAFYDRFWNFTYIEGAGEERDGVEVGRFVSSGAALAGGEVEVALHLLEGGPHRIHVIGRADGVYAQNLDTDEPLPRMPPVRFGGSLVYEYGTFQAQFDALRAMAQERVPDGEFTTAGYTMLDLGFDYALEHLDWPVTPEFFFRVANLLDVEARASESFLRDQAPLPGRNFTGGVRITF